MTEAEWNACTDPAPVLWFLRNASPRKLRLFANYCCRRCWKLLKDYRSRKAVEESEKFVEGESSVKKLAAAREAAFEVVQEWSASFERRRRGLRGDAEAALLATGNAIDAAWLVAGELAWEVLCNLIDSVQSAAQVEMQAGEAARESLCDILRDIFGPLPYRPVALAPAWITAVVKQLAQAIYDEKAFDRMPILADALEDAGCTNADILTHCRQPGDHVRGCWVVDLLLGKE